MLGRLYDCNSWITTIFQNESAAMAQNFDCFYAWGWSITCTGHQAIVRAQWEIPNDISPMGSMGKSLWNWCLISGLIITLWHFDIFQTHPRYQNKNTSPWAFRGMVSSQSFRMIERTLKPLDLDPLYQHFGYYGIGSLWILWDFLECFFTHLGLFGGTIWYHPPEKSEFICY